MKTVGKYTFFYKDTIAQWHKANMIDWKSKVTFNTAEQYMMYQKAMLFNDRETAVNILQTDSPKKQQDYGRVVKNFDNIKWEQNRERIVYNGNLLKFTQHPYLLHTLLDTIGTTLVEASPVDLIWGVGLSIDDPLIEDSNNWRGKNLLGYTLTHLRDSIYHHLIDMEQLS